MKSDWYNVRFKGTKIKTFFKEVENKNDNNEYYWTVVGLTPYTKYTFRVVILLLGTESVIPEYLDIDDTKEIHSIITQPSLVVRTDPSEVEAPSKPIIVSVQQVSFGLNFIYFQE